MGANGEIELFKIEFNFPEDDWYVASNQFVSMYTRTYVQFNTIRYVTFQLSSNRSVSIKIINNEGVILANLKNTMERKKQHAIKENIFKYKKDVWGTIFWGGSIFSINAKKSTCFLNSFRWICVFYTFYSSVYKGYFLMC